MFILDVPEGLGLIEKVRGEKAWSGFCWYTGVCAGLVIVVAITPVAILFIERA